MKFSKNFFQTWNILEYQVKQFSEDSSPCPKIPIELNCKGQFLKDARTSLACLAVLPLLNPGVDGYYRIQNIRNHILRMTEQYKSQGDWKIVEEILSSTDSLTLEPTWSIIMKNMNENDWFGNFVPLMKQAIRSTKWRKVYTNNLEDNRPVKKPQRKRGYDDKGSLKPPHLWLPWNAFSRKEIPKIVIKEPKPFQWFSKRRR